jgi:arabinogalactan oligomer/maltooligosaccharide transport system substrate-binding protein
MPDPPEPTLEPTPTELPPTPTSTPEPIETAEPVAVALGLTLWHPFAEGSPEEAIVAAQVEQLRRQRPELPLNVLRVDGSTLAYRFEAEAAAGGGPDVAIITDEVLGREARAGLLLSPDDIAHDEAARPEGLSVEPVDGKGYAVRLTRTTIAMYFNRERVPEPPATTQALLDAARAGTRVVLTRSAFHNFGFFGAFGGQLFDDTGRCVADTGGFAEALAYLDELKAAGVVFATGGAEAAERFRSGEADIVVDGSWMLADFSAALGDRLGVAALPAGPVGPARPMIGGNVIVINASSQQPADAMSLAAALAAPEAQQQLAEQTRALPGDPAIAIADPALGGLAAAALSGVSRPQRAELDAFWRPFDRALAEVLDSDVAPPDAVSHACATMNANNGR